MIQIVLSIIILGIISLLFINSFINFYDAKRYIQMEIDRSYDDESEYRYWRHKMKKLYKKHFPIIWRLFYRK